MKKNVLAIETSSPILSVALQKGDETILESKIEDLMSHAEQLLPAVEKLLKRAKLTLDDIDAFLIGRGPGSFTGLRIGFATLKGFLAAERKKCFGALSLDTIAAGVSLPEKSRLAVCLDARRDKIYVRFYKKGKEGWKPEKKAGVLSSEDFMRCLPDDIYLTGDAIGKYREALCSQRTDRKIHYLPESLWYPRASYMIPWYRNPSKGWLKPLQTPHDFVPFYLRLSEAEEKRRKHALAR